MARRTGCAQLQWLARWLDSDTRAVPVARAISSTSRGKSVHLGLLPLLLSNGRRSARRRHAKRKPGARCRGGAPPAARPV